MHERKVIHQCGRARVGTRVGGDDPVQQGAEGAVRCVLRAPGHLLAGIAGHLQRLPADGAAELRAVEGHRGGEAAALHPEQVGPLRVALREYARGEVERHHASWHGGLHAGRVGGARRGPLLLAGRRGEGGVCPAKALCY